MVKVQVDLMASLVDGLNFDSVINNFAERKARKVCKFSTDLMPCGSSLTQTVLYTSSLTVIR